MNRLDFRYVIRRMIRFIWIAFLVGALLAGVIAVRDQSKKDDRATEPVTANQPSLLYADYQGDWRAHGLSSRFIFLDYTFREDAVTSLGDAIRNRGLAEYSWEMGNLIVQRIYNISTLQRLYAKMSEHFPEIRENPRGNNYGIVYEMMTVEVERQSCIRIRICPSPYAEFWSTEAQCDYRDYLYDLVSALVDEGTLTEDLPIRITRSDAGTESVMEEQDYVLNVLQDSPIVSENKSIPWKKLLVFFALGFALTEAIVLLIAVLNNTIKSAKDLTNNTDLEVLDEIQPGEDQNWRVLAEKLIVNIPPDSRLVIIRDQTVSGSEWSEKIGNAAVEIGGKLSVSEMTGLKLSAEDLHELSQAKVLLAVKKEKTKYPELRTLSETLRQMKAEVVGAIIEN